MLRFKVDENLPNEVAGLPRVSGFDAETALDEDLGGQTDQVIAQRCKREGRVILSLDKGFSDIRKYPPNDYSGLIVLRLRKQDKPLVLQLVRRLPPKLVVEDAESELVGALWIVTEDAIRIRVI